MSVPEPTADSVRACLLGHAGPYAHPRDAVDALDNLAEWRMALDSAGLALMARSLCELLGDADPVVRTGAALGLAALGTDTDPDDVLAAATRHSALLDQPPLGFAAAWKPTILAEVVLVVAATALPSHAPMITAWLDDPPGGLSPDQLGAAVAPRLPGTLLWEPRRWFDTRHTAVLVRFPLHWQRRSFALALSPWPTIAVERVRVAATTLHWADGDLDPLLEAMSGRHVPGGRPEGLTGSSPATGRWWAFDEAPYDWTLWRDEQGAVALEVLLPGWAMTCRSRLLDDNEVATYLSEGATSLTEWVEELRRA